MKVSVIIPTHNRADSVVHAVRSALWQTHPNLEIIVVDDGSDDSTSAALEPYASQIRYLRQDQRGPSAARNTGANASSGKFLAFLDSDDLWLPWHLSNQLDFLSRLDPTVPCCVTNAWITRPADGAVFTSFDDAGIRPSSHESLLHNPLETLSGRFLLFNQTTTIRRTAFERVGGYDESLRLLEDYSLALHLARQSPSPWALIRTPGVVKPNHPDGLGVACMADPIRHNAAKRHLLEVILGDPSFPSSRAKSLLHLALLGISSPDHRPIAAARAIACSALHRATRRFIRPVITSVFE